MPEDDDRTPGIEKVRRVLADVYDPDAHALRVMYVPPPSPPAIAEGVEASTAKVHSPDTKRSFWQRLRRKRDDGAAVEQENTIAPSTS